MNLADYKEYMPQSNISEDALMLFEFFEPLTDEFFKIEKPFDNRNKTEPYFRKVKQSMGQTRSSDGPISSAISNLSQKTRNDALSRSIFYSLYQNYKQFIAMNNSRSDIYIRKWIKVLCSAYTATRFAVVMSILRLENKKRQLLLATGIVDSFDDPGTAESVKEEIDYIWCKSFHDKNTLVVPFISCTFYMFQRLMSSKCFTCMHIAGHGNYTHLNFFNEYIDYNQFANCINNDMEFSLLNCCCTYDFVGRQTIPGCKTTIAHRDTVRNDVALDFTRDFYDMILRKRSDVVSTANQCIGMAKHSEQSPHEYYLLQ